MTPMFTSTTAVTTNMTNITVVTNVSLVIVEWVEGAWSTCSTRCGKGTSFRTFTCSLEEPLACGHLPGPEEKACVDHSVCFLGLPCSLSGDESETCYAETIVVVVAVLIVASVACVCLCFCDAARQLLHPHRGGHAWIDALQGFAHFGVTKKRHRDPASGRWVTKEHVTWDFDWQKFHDIFGNDGLTADDSMEAAVPDLDLEAMVVTFDRKSSCSSGFTEEGTFDTESACWTREGSEKAAAVLRVQLAYEEGSVVEYYSTSLDRWVIGKMAPVEFIEGFLDNERLVLYCVRVGVAQQYRHDVRLHHLRRPLQCMEGVEVKTGALCWQPGRISHIKYCAKGRIYQVSLDQHMTEGSSVIVPGTKLRRHFKAGSAVLAFRGTSRGWVSGVMQDSLELVAPDATELSPRWVKLMSRGCDPDAPPIQHTEEPYDDPNPRMLPVLFGSELEWVPAHLVDTEF